MAWKLKGVSDPVVFVQCVSCSKGHSVWCHKTRKENATVWVAPTRAEVVEALSEIEWIEHEGGLLCPSCQEEKGLAPVEIEIAGRKRKVKQGALGKDSAKLKP